VALNRTEEGLLLAQVSDISDVIGEQEKWKLANAEMAALAGSVSHDLRAPLRQMEGFAEILRDEYGAALGDAGRQLVVRIGHAAHHMSRMLSDLLDFSRLGQQTLNRIACDIRQLALQVIAGTDGAAAAKFEVGEIGYADCDPDLVRQLLQNLISNAVKFTGQRSNARIEIGRAGVDGETAYFVRDNGVGFPASQADRLFQIFQRLHRQEDFAGTGVGLASVRRIAERHGGRVWAESHLGEGAVFYFTLGSAEEK
jgi:signal transduction histidine kinase